MCWGSQEDAFIWAVLKIHVVHAKWEHFYERIPTADLSETLSIIKHISSILKDVYKKQLLIHFCFTEILATKIQYIMPFELIDTIDR